MNTNLGLMKKVLIWGREDLFCQAVESLLAAQNEWEVVRVSDDQGNEGLLEAVEQIRPDVVIIHQGDCNGDVPFSMDLFKERPEMRVISVSLENNAMEVFNKQKVWVKQVSDLLSVIES